jgi:hypothetical protein
MYECLLEISSAAVEESRSGPKGACNDHGR